MIHHRQSLPLGFEAREHLLRIHTRFDELHGHLALHRLRLLSQPNTAHAAFADSLDQLVLVGQNQADALVGNHREIAAIAVDYFKRLEIRPVPVLQATASTFDQLDVALVLIHAHDAAAEHHVSRNDV